jgi:hypothetical protein
VLSVACVELLTVCVCGHEKVAFNGCEDLEGAAYSTFIGVSSFLMAVRILEGAAYDTCICVSRFLTAVRILKGLRAVRVSVTVVPLRL